MEKFNTSLFCGIDDSKNNTYSLTDMYCREVLPPSNKYVTSTYVNPNNFRKTDLICSETVMSYECIVLQSPILKSIENTSYEMTINLKNLVYSNVTIRKDETTMGFFEKPEAFEFLAKELQEAITFSILNSIKKLYLYNIVFIKKLVIEELIISFDGVHSNV